MKCNYESFQNYSFLVCSCLSLVGSLAVLVSIITKKMFSCYSFKILLFISANDLIRAIFGILIVNIEISNSICIFYSYMAHALTISNAAFASFITWTIYKIVVVEVDIFSKNFNFWLVFTYGVPFSLCLLPIITNSYAYKSGICDLKTDLIGTIWRFLMAYLLIIVNLVFSFVLSVKIFKKISKFDDFPASSIIINRGLIYAIIIGICEVPLLAFRIAQIFSSDCIILLFVLISLDSFQLQGFLNAIVFFSNRSVRDVLRKNSEISRNSSDFIYQSLRLSYASTIN